MASDNFIISSLSSSVNMFKIEQDKAQAILEYLLRHPYAEVYKFIEWLQRLERIDVTEREVKPYVQSSESKGEENASSNEEIKNDQSHG